MVVVSTQRGRERDCICEYVVCLLLFVAHSAHSFAGFVCSRLKLHKRVRARSQSCHGDRQTDKIQQGLRFSY